MSQMPEKTFIPTIDEAVRRLVTVEHFHAGSIVSMPSMYPSGASVLIEISAQAGRVFVSDRGGGYNEAEFMGTTRQFAREAERVAGESGIRFDGRNMFVAEVPIDRVDGAMIAVAHCSAQAAAFAALKAAERHERDVKEAMFEKLADVFGASGFERDIDVIGASNHKWKVDALVRDASRVVIFNAVTKHYVSATGTAAKFGDFGRLEIAPRRVAVTPSIIGLGDWFGLVNSSSDAIVEISAANDQFIRARSAA
ncbi:MAG: hypothetical protein QM651_14730 [Rhodoblastus sp.]